MDDKLKALAGTVILIGDQVRDALTAAMQTKDLPQIRALLKDAEERVDVIIQAAKATKSDVEV